jgi:hypothetical protein
MPTEKIDGMYFDGTFNAAMIAWAGLPETAFVLDREDGLGRLCVNTPDGFRDALPGDYIRKVGEALFVIDRRSVN